MKQLNESRDLFKGIFWIVDLTDIDSNKNYCFTIPCNSDGTSYVDIDTSVKGKSGDTYNHQRYWGMLPRSMTHGKTFDYYPRGRVEIANGKATIYLNPNIAYDDVGQFIIDQFNLTKSNGINKVRMFADGSEHYKCYLDR